MIAVIDEKLMAAHQWVVDATQKQPAWLARQVAMLVLITGVIRHYGAQDWLGVFATMAMAGLFFALSFSNAHLAAVGSVRWIRIAFVAAFILALVMRAIEGEMGVGALKLIGGISLVAFYYLAACKPPRPRLPKHKFQPEAA